MSIISKFNLAVLAMAAAGAFPVFADDVCFYSGDLYYRVLSESDKTVELISLPEDADGRYTGSVNIPSKVTNAEVEYTVVSIGESAFEFCFGVLDVTLPESLQTIGTHAFYGCQRLTSLSVPQTVTKIGDEAFAQCYKLAEVTLPDNITSIPYALFQSCEKLNNLTIPAGVTQIGTWAFSGCESISEIAIPDNVASIGEYAFYNCSGLVDISFGEGLVSIGGNSFQGCKKLSEITIPKSLKEIGVAAFSECSSLTDINVDSENEFYSSYDGVLYTKDYSMLLNCPTSKTSATISDQTKTIQEGAFSYAKIEKIEGAANLEEIGNNCFEGCSALVEFPFGSKLKTIGSRAFSSSGLEYVILPESLTSLESYAFSSCANLKYVNIRSGSKFTVPSNCFSGCKSIVKVVIGENVDYISDSAFNQCAAIQEIISYAVTPPYMGNSVFAYDVRENASLLVPESAIGEYKEANQWKNFKNISAYVASTLAINVDDIASNAANVTVKPSDDSLYWFAGVSLLSEYPGENIWADKVAEWKEAGGDDWMETYRSVSKTGEQTLTFDELESSTEYIAYCFALDANGFLDIPVASVDFTTAEEPVKATLEISVPKTTDNSADVTVVPSDDNVRWFADVVIKTEYPGENVWSVKVDEWKNAAGDNWMETYRSVSHTGEQTLTFENLVSGTEYVAYCFALGENGELSVPVESYEFTIVSSSVGVIESNDSPAVTVEGRDIIIDGVIASAAVYSADGRMVATFSDNVCSVDANGVYIVRMETPAGVKNVKIFVK